jgi:hypothetical protein
MLMTTLEEAKALMAAADHYPWDPVSWPIRVLFVKRGSGYGGNYISRAYTFATVEEAKDFIPKVQPRHPKGCKVWLQRATVAPNGRHDGWVDAK